MPRLKVRNLMYLLVATLCILLYYNALVPSQNNDQDVDDEELVDRWIEKKLSLVMSKGELDSLAAGMQKEAKKGPFNKTEKLINRSRANPVLEVNKRDAKPKTVDVAGNVKKPAANDKPADRAVKDKSARKSQPKDAKKESKEDWMKRMARVQTQRKAHLRKECDGWLQRPLKSMDELGSNPKALRPLIINDKHRFIFSIVYKVGSTNWERVIVEDLEGHKNVPNQQLFSHKALRWMPGFTPEEAKVRLKTYIKFLFVRNPLSRIISAYKDKFVDNHNAVFTKMARTIINLYRKGPKAKDATDVTFPEFVEYLVNSSNHRSNPHWKVIFNQNFPCELNYDIIGRLEDADEDIPYVLEMVGIQNLTSFGSVPLKRKGSDEELWSQYFSLLPAVLLQNFYAVYKADFVLYGYDMPKSF